MMVCVKRETERGEKEFQISVSKLNVPDSTQNQQNMINIKKKPKMMIFLNIFLFFHSLRERGLSLCSRQRKVTVSL